MQDISILHRHSHKGFQGITDQNLVWKTCLRQIVFLPDGSNVPFEEGDELYSGTEAFAFLLEIICGLRSPIVGETEIFGQFKNFTSQALELKSAMTLQLRGFFQSLIQVAKSLRAEHLVGLGSQGYGSLVRKLSKNNPGVTLLGSGQLVEEILPWLSKQKDLQVICRHPEKAQRFVEKIPALKIDSFIGVEEVYPCLVVAAPLSDDELLQWLKPHKAQNKIQKILDLRGELEKPELFYEYQFIGLKEVFKNIEENKKDLSQRVLTLKDLVQRRAQEYFERSLHRPFGWEDLCV
jgi:glutamyl-tRNA reductase